MPLGLVLFLIVMVSMFAWLQGWRQGYADAEQYTEYWHENSCKWFDVAMHLMAQLDDEPDGGISKRPPKAEVEPVKVMAKAAGVSR